MKTQTEKESIQTKDEKQTPISCSNVVVAGGAQSPFARAKYATIWWLGALVGVFVMI